MISPYSPALHVYHKVFTRYIFTYVLKIIQHKMPKTFGNHGHIGVHNACDATTDERGEITLK